MSEEQTEQTEETGKPAVKTDKIGSEKLKILESIEVSMSIEVGRTEMTIKDLLLLNEGSIVELDRLAGEPLDILVNGAIIAKGEVVMVGERVSCPIRACECIHKCIQ